MSDIENNICVNPAHRDPDVLFGRECNNCGILPVYTDDLQFQFSSNICPLNQEWIMGNFIKIRDFLNDNGLQINEAKTSLIHFLRRLFTFEF